MILTVKIRMLTYNGYIIKRNPKKSCWVIPDGNSIGFSSEPSACPPSGIGKLNMSLKAEPGIMKPYFGTLKITPSTWKWIQSEGSVWNIKHPPNPKDHRVEIVNSMASQVLLGVINLRRNGGFVVNKHHIAVNVALRFESSRWSREGNPSGAYFLLIIGLIDGSGRFRRCVVSHHETMHAQSWLHPIARNPICLSLGLVFSRSSWF